MYQTDLILVKIKLKFLYTLSNIPTKVKKIQGINIRHMEEDVRVNEKEII